MTDLMLAKPEADYLELARLSKKLGLPVPMMHLKLESRDRNGNLVDYYEARSRTYNRNFYNWIFAFFGAICGGGDSSNLSSDTTFGAGHLPIKTTAGSVTNANATNALGASIFGAYTASAADNTHGIVIGTSTAAENFEDVALTALIAEGTGAGQMNYTAQTYTQPSYNAGSKTWTAAEVRIINNNSAGTITVNETAIYVQSRASNTYMLSRDKLSSGQAVLAAGQLTVTYTTTLVFPS